ncbi:MAG: arylsulfatase [Lentisphaeraceae bacterium]|nr:arylsulfatase [Lentisphaeraceae bacterium]
MKLLSALLITLFLTSCSTAEATKEKKPNVIVILSDDMGFSDIGCYGSEIETPNLDKMASNGLRFSQFYNTGRCCPTRASLLTGVYQHQAGIGWMTTDRKQRGYKGDLSKEVVTIAEVMKTAGYSTYLSGKWHITPYHLTNYSKHNWPKQRGFDRFYGTILGAGSFYDPTGLTRENDYISPLNDPEYKPETYYYTHAISDHAVRYIKEHDKEKPFFMYVSYTAAHWPMHALKKDIDKYDGKYDEGYEAIRKKRIEKMKKLGIIAPQWQITPRDGKPWSTVKNKEWEAACMEVYAAMVDSMDQGIGQIIDELDNKGELENTLILYLQDNGGCAEGLGRRPRKPIKTTMTKEQFQGKMIPDVTRENKPVLTGQDVMPGGPDSYIAYGRDWANVSNTPFRLYKHYVHEGGVATPLVAHWPAGIKAKNKWRHTPTHLIDIMATCIDLGDAKYPSEYKGNTIVPLEGKSLKTVFENDNMEDRQIFFEHEKNRAIRDGKWKLVAKGLEGKWELYDMDKDRTEMNDLAEKMPAKAKELEDAWEAWAQRAHVKPFPIKKNKKRKK